MLNLPYNFLFKSHPMVGLLVQGDGEFIEKIRGTLKIPVVEIRLLKSKQDVIDFADKSQLDIVVFDADPLKKDTQEIFTYLKERGSVYVDIHGTTFDEAVKRMERAIHESRLRTLKHIARIDLCVGSLCFFLIILFAYLSQSPIGRFLGTFLASVLLIEFFLFYFGSSDRGNNQA